MQTLEHWLSKREESWWKRASVRLKSPSCVATVPMVKSASIGGPSTNRLTMDTITKVARESFFSNTRKYVLLCNNLNHIDRNSWSNGTTDLMAVDSMNWTPSNQIAIDMQLLFPFLMMALNRPNFSSKSPSSTTWCPKKTNVSKLNCSTRAVALLWAPSPKWPSPSPTMKVFPPLLEMIPQSGRTILRQGWKIKDPNYLSS